MSTAQPKSLYLTAPGEALSEQHPEVIDQFIETAADLTQYRPQHAQELEFIGRGSIGAVYGLPDQPDLCLKVITPRTDRSGMYSGSLVTEAKFMDKISSGLQRTAEGVWAPTHYAVARFAGGSALLQQRIPDTHKSLHQLLDDAPDSAARDKWRAQGLTAAKRAESALAKLRLRFGVGDLMCQDNRYNGGNILVDRSGVTPNNDVYVIDLVAPKKLRQLIALGSTALAR